MIDVQISNAHKSRERTLIELAAYMNLGLTLMNITSSHNESTNAWIEFE